MYLFVIFFMSTIFMLESAKILAIFPSPGYSQYFIGEPLLINLVKRGHNITLISFYKPKPPVNNINAIEVKDLIQIQDEENFVELYSRNIFVIIRNAFADYHAVSTEKMLKDENVQKLINSNASFDLVLLENAGNEPLMVFAHHFKVPLVILSSIGASDWINHLIANPAPYSYVPYTFSKFSTTMNIWERIQNFFAHTYSLYVKYFILLPKYEEIVKKYFPKPPLIEEIMYNASIILLNSHPAVTPAYPTTSNMIEIGGFHIQPEALTKDIEEFLNNSTNGVIYFSMGTNLDINRLSNENTAEVFKVFAKITENVVWKASDENLPGKPDNVLMRKWVPQRAILGHRKVKAFISHCGLIGMLETVYFGVPVICIPVITDQFMNSAFATENGVAITIPFQELNERTLMRALHEILTNNTYTENAKERSKFFQDTSIKPMDLAIHWIEFVIRHKGAPHLRNPGLNLYWYQYYYLDALFVLIIITILVLFLFNLKRRFKSKRNKKKIE